MLIHFSDPAAPRSHGRGRLQTYALIVAALGAGALLLAFGLIVLAGLAVTGTVVGGGIGLYHRLTGRWPKFLRVTSYGGPLGGVERAHGLDPSKEVFPPTRETPRLPGESDSSSGA